MARIHCKMSPLAVYLIVLAFYSAFMMLACLNVSLEEEEDVREPIRTKLAALQIGEEMGMEYKDEVEEEEEARSVRNKINGRAQHSRSWLRTVDDFYTRAGTLETKCTKTVSFGGTYCRGAKDNNKVVCMDEDVALIPKHCTAYSFGIGSDATFDDQMARYGCDVFMFDPSVSKGPIESSNLARQTFNLLGLDVSTYNRTHRLEYVEDGRTEDVVGTYDTYDNIRRYLGHESRPVHYLKLDIENTEWRVLPYLMENSRLAGVKQLAIEVHTMGILYAPQHKVLDMLYKFWEILEGLTRLGFLRAWYRPNLVLESLYKVPGQNRSIATCFEVLYLRRGPVY